MDDVTFDEIEIRLRKIAEQRTAVHSIPLNAVALRLISPFEQELTTNQVAAVNLARVQYRGVATFERDLKDAYVRLSANFGRLRGREDALNRLAALCICPTYSKHQNTDLIDLLIELCEALLVAPATLNAALDLELASVEATKSIWNWPANKRG
ncbi:hypothetical protein [Mesorhizobium sp. KR9-304]|uniref:hypothetical protein n=1 Tax=Mesorhizobium sp. KR9-304 TaxID=3156614 RepID=UPI0032B55B42